MHWRKWRYWRYRQKRQDRHAKIYMAEMAKVAKNALHYLHYLHFLPVLPLLPQHFLTKVQKVQKVQSKKLIKQKLTESEVIKKPAKTSRNNAFMRRIGFIWIVGIFLLLFVVPVSAQEIPDFNTDSLTMDSIAIDSLDPDPEWYVAPVIPASLRAPMRTSATAASCNRVEAIQIFDIDSVLTEGTYYEYDDRGNVISTTVWTYNPDGTMTGKSKNEYAFDAAGTQTMTAVYIWDGTANDWKGTEKYEYIYQTVAGEKKMISNTSLIWLNGAWVADHRYTYGYDGAGREISYFEYNRNTTTNELQPVLGREQGWTNDLQTLEANYTAYANGQWTAGTKKEWTFDENGTQTMFTTFTMSNGAWVGSSKETWTYGGPSAQLTLHEKYGWANNDWSKTLKEETEYAGTNIIRIENYTYSNGVTTGTKKEQYSFDGGKPVLTMVYAWSNGAWIGSSKEVWNYNASSKLTLHEKYGWTNNDWSLTLQEKTAYSGANITLIENYTWSNGVKTGTKKEEYTYSGSLKTSFVTYSWAGSDWVGVSKEIWAYTSGKQTLHETYAWGATDWSITLQENTAYSGANITKIENYAWTNGTKTGTQKEIWAYTSGKQTLHETYAWGTTDWSITLQENTAYSGANITKIENYTWTNGVKNGTKKEEYTYSGSLKMQEIIYAWANDVWVETTKEVWGHTSGKLTHHEQYTWNGDWSKTLEEYTTYDGANITKIENYTYSDGVKTGTQKEEYTYTSGEKTMTVVYAWANNDWVYSTKNEAGYRNGNVEVSATNYAWNGSAWVGTGTRTQTTYDGSKIIEKLTKNWPSGATEWTNAAITTNAYNAEDINVLVYNGTWDGNKWVLHSMARLDIIKDAAGHELLNASWTCGSDSVWAGVKKDTAAYTATNKPLYVASYKSWSNGNWVPYSKSEYTYDANDHQILYMQYEGKNGVWVNKVKTEQAYDAAGNQTLLQGFNWSNSKWVGVYKYEYSYDTNGRQTMQAHYEWSSGRWSGFSRSDTEYDAAGNVSASISFKWKNNAWVGNSRTENVYDAKKRVVEYTLKKWQSNKWVNSRHTIYVYDSFDRLVSTRQYWWYNNEWTIYGINESTYDPSTNVLRRELSVSWLDNEIDSYSDNHYFYNCDPHFYTVRFVNYDGQVLANMTAQEGETPVYPGSTPTKPADTENTYTFSGWTPALAPVTANITYTATFTAVKKAYTITWKNEDGSIIKQEKLEYGTTPAHADITKENTAEWTYTFAGWTPGIGIVTGDAEYTATFTQTKNSYLITFQNEDGTVLSSETYEYGAMPTIPTTPAKPADGANTYTFAGWDKEIVPVTEATTYTATFTATKNTYTITWKNEDGTVLQSGEVAYGEAPVYTGEMPSRPNTAEYTYTFAGWTPEVETVTSDATYTATFDSIVNSYTVNWLNEDGSVIASETLEYGATPAHADISKESTAEFTYTFAGWTPGIGIVTGDAAYTAQFNATKNSYYITWLNSDNSQLDQTLVEYGVVPTHTAPTKEATDEHSYFFDKWTPDVVAVTGETTYKASYTETTKVYTITWLNEDGTEISHETLEYGATPSHVDPTKEATAEFTYTFAGWTPGIGIVTGNASYQATFSATKNSYTITWLNEDGSEIEHETLEYGATPSHADVTKESTAEYTYAFAGWTPDVVAAVADATYQAAFSQTKNSYTITWLDDEGTLVDQTKVAYGATPAHANIYKESDSQYDYTFVGWTPTLVPVTGDASYSAIFTTAGKSYTVTFYFEDGVTVLDQMTLPYGAIPSTPYIPSIPSDANHTYTFSGWSPEIAPVTGDISYVPTFTAIPNQYTVIFRNYNGKELQRKKVDYGTVPEYEGDEPSRPATNAYTWAFEGWTPELTAVIGDATYTAVYTKVMNTYTILFYDEDGITLLDEVTVEHGQKPTTSVIPTKEADEEYRYTFAGWSPKIAKATSDAEYIATYLATPKTQGLGDVQRDDVQCTKVLLDGTIYIRRGGNTYSIDGQRVK